VLNVSSSDDRLLPVVPQVPAWPELTSYVTARGNFSRGAAAVESGGDPLEHTRDLSLNSDEVERGTQRNLPLGESRVAGPATVIAAGGRLRLRASAIPARF
jgi:hypothetical protein